MNGAGTDETRDGLEQLIERVAAHDLDAFATLHEELYSEVFGLAVWVLREQMLAEDVTQEVFTWIWEHAATFDPQVGSPRVWVRTMRGASALRGHSAGRKRAERVLSDHKRGLADFPRRRVS